MSTADDRFDMRNFEENWNRAEVVPGDTIFALGHEWAPGWKFIGIPGTNIGLSYYSVTKKTNPVTLDALTLRVSP